MSVEELDNREYMDIKLDFFQDGNIQIIPSGNQVEIRMLYPSGMNYSRKLSRDEWERFRRKVRKMTLILQRRDLMNRGKIREI